MKEKNIQFCAKEVGNSILNTTEEGINEMTSDRILPKDRRKEKKSAK